MKLLNLKCEVLSPYHSRDIAKNCKKYMKTEPYIYGFSISYIYGNMDILPKAIKTIIMAILVLDKVTCVIFT